MKKLHGDSYFEIIGTSGNEVTGSCYLFHYKKKNILIECGLRQTNNIQEDYKANREIVKKLKPKSIDIILISHLHQDHNGNIPWLYKNGCTAPIYCIEGSSDILKLMWEDSAKIQQSDSEKLKKQGMKNANPLYTNEDIGIALSHVIEIEYNRPISYGKNIEFEFYPSNHCLHGSQILLTLKDNLCVKKIGFTGDIGSPNMKKRYLKEFQVLPRVDILIGECTYSEKARGLKSRDRGNDIAKLCSTIQDAKEKNKKVLIPVFSFQRLEDILTQIYLAFNGDCPLPIIIDTPLGKKIAHIWESDVEKDNQLWDNIYNWDNLTWIEDFNDSRNMMKNNNPYVILSSSGMMTGGRSSEWAKNILPDSENCILFCGYSSDGTLASDIKNGRRTVRISGENISNKAKLVVLNSFSSHACYEELMELYSERYKYGKLYLVHSDEHKFEFSKELKKILEENNNTSRVIATGANDSFRF